MRDGMRWCVLGLGGLGCVSERWCDVVWAVLVRDGVRWHGVGCVSERWCEVVWLC